MVQIIKENRKPTFSERLNRSLKTGVEQGSQLFENYQEQQKQAQREHQKRQALTSLVGEQGEAIADLPPELQKLYIDYALQGQQQQQLERLKQSGKENLVQRKQSFLNDILGTKESKESSIQPGGFDPSQISDADIAQATAVDPALGRELRAAKDTSLREKRAERDFQERKKEKSPEAVREKQLSTAQASADVKYNQELQSAEKQHKLKTKSLENLERLNKKGVTGKPYEKLLERAGLVNLTSEGRREFAADVKNLITDIRSILGSQFSQFEFQTLLNAYPSADFSQDANGAIIKNLQAFQDIRDQEFKIANQLKKENSGKIPADFQSIVNDRLNEYTQSRVPEIKENTRRIMNEEYGIRPGMILMFDPMGEPLEVPPEEAERYQSLGATLP